MANPVAGLLTDPWTALDAMLDGPLHPGGEAATEALLDRAGVGEGTRLLDAGCGDGTALALARERGAAAVGVDADPRDAGAIKGNFEALPVADGAVDVVLAECALCLADDLDDALAEIHRALGPGGRLALSDVVVSEDAPDVPDALARACCLTDPPTTAELEASVRAAGFEVRAVRDHHDDVLAFRDRVYERVNVDRLLGLADPELRSEVQRLETAVEAGRVGYVSVLADR